MRQTAIAMLALVVLLSMASFPAKVSGATDEYESLEFFLDQALKRVKDPEKRAEILNLYLIKALGLVYQQNQELIRLQRQLLDATQELRDIKKKEIREMEIQIQKNQWKRLDCELRIADFGFKKRRRQRFSCGSGFQPRFEQLLRLERFERLD